MHTMSKKFVFFIPRWCSPKDGEFFLREEGGKRERHRKKESKKETERE